jgi:hypothetical protein
MVFGRPLLPGVFSEEQYMRIRVPGHFVAALAILAAVLCLLPASTKVAVARPIGWEDVGPPDPDPKGDNDGVVLKAPSLRPISGPNEQVPGGNYGSVGTVRIARYDFRGVRLFFAVTRVNYWPFWLR